jgi:hypothetical protein
MEFFKTQHDANVKTYPVSDFYLAAFLKAKGFKLLNMERDGRRVVFQFEDRDDRSQLTKDFYNDGLIQVSPFIHAIQDLKSIIYNLPKKEETPISKKTEAE